MLGAHKTLNRNLVSRESVKLLIGVQLHQGPFENNHRNPTELKMKDAVKELF